MLIAHLPAGYIVGKTLVKRLGISVKRSRVFTLTLMVGSVLPDLDLVYFYWFDNPQHIRHAYASHIPSYWLAAMTVIFCVTLVCRWPKLLVLSLGVFVGGLLHLALDSVVGVGIQWGFPFSDAYYSLIRLPPEYSRGLWNYLLHWSFIFEVIILIWALLVLRSSHAEYDKAALPRFPEA